MQEEQSGGGVEEQTPRSTKTDKKRSSDAKVERKE